MKLFTSIVAALVLTSNPLFGQDAESRALETHSPFAAD